MGTIACYEKTAMGKTKIIKNPALAIRGQPTFHFYEKGKITVTRNS